MQTLVNSVPDLKLLVKQIKQDMLPVNKVQTLFTAIVPFTTPTKALRFINRQIKQWPANECELCSECGLPNKATRMTFVYHGDPVCESCLADFYTHSGYREGPNGDSIMTFTHVNDVGDRRHGSAIAGLYPYNANILEYTGFYGGTDRKRAVFKDSLNPIPYLGVEVETELRRNADHTTIASKISSVFNKDGRPFVICKSDGSLHNGLEVVTAPATYEYHMGGVWEPFFQENNGPAQYLRAWRTDTCGVHVHISKEAFTPIHAAKFLMFYNMDANEKFLADIAGRGPNRYARRYAKKAKDVSWGETKYEAVNVGRLRPTLEVRIFRGNVAREGLYRYIEFVQSTYEFTRQASLKGIEYQEYVKFMNRPENRHRFPNLYRWLCNYLYLKPAHKTDLKATHERVSKSCA